MVAIPESQPVFPRQSDGTTTDDWQTIFDEIVPEGMARVCVIKNTGAAGLTIRLTIADAFDGEDQTNTSALAAGSAVDVGTLASALFSISSPYGHIKVEVQSALPGVDTDFKLRMAGQG